MLALKSCRTVEKQLVVVVDRDGQCVEARVAQDAVGPAFVVNVGPAQALVQAVVDALNDAEKAPAVEALADSPPAEDDAPAKKRGAK